MKVIKKRSSDFVPVVIHKGGLGRVVECPNWGSIIASGSEKDASWIIPVIRSKRSATGESTSVSDNRLLTYTSGLTVQIEKICEPGYRCGSKILNTFAENVFRGKCSDYSTKLTRAKATLLRQFINRQPLGLHDEHVRNARFDNDAHSCRLEKDHRALLFRVINRRKRMLRDS